MLIVHPLQLLLAAHLFDGLDHRPLQQRLVARRIGEGYPLFGAPAPPPADAFRHIPEIILLRNDQKKRIGNVGFMTARSTSTVEGATPIQITKENQCNSCSS